MIMIKYGVFCEDEPHRIFIINLLNQITKLYENQVIISFIFNHDFKIRYGANFNRNQVKGRYLDVIKDSFIIYSLDLLFIGYDYDYHDENSFDKEYEKEVEKIKKLKSNFINKTILFIPVQCIEHWLWYLKLKENGGNIQRKIILEKRERNEAKEAVYENKKGIKDFRNMIANSLTEQIDVLWLKQKSFSFRKFYNHFESYMKSNTSK
ncbi:MAG: hypothetical protein HW421_2284 [Ignavibacteria bacterium]|nr:hypothetical protein [Ignavibacteria bacterium]